MIKAGAGGLVSADWCIDQFADRIAALPCSLTEADTTRSELLLHEQLYGKKRLQICYTPFDRCNPTAQVLLVGISPGRHQHLLALQAARAALREGSTPDEAVRRAKNSASFAGAMRKNAVNMLDEIGIPRALGITGSDTLFGDNARLRGGTSAICHAVYVDGANYTGHGLERIPALRAFASQVLGAEIEATPHALVIPFGDAASKAVQLAINSGRVSPSRCLPGFPHPSGANGWRVRRFKDAKHDLRRAVAAWQG
ncbi:hypothetical protein [Streptomyces sp. NPDC055189]